MASKRCKAAACSAVPHPGLPERPREPREGLYSQPHRTDAGTIMRLSTNELVRLAPKWTWPHDREHMWEVISPHLSCYEVGLDPVCHSALMHLTLHRHST